MKFKRTILSAALSCMLLTNTAYAASVHDMNLRGWEAVPATTQTLIEDGIKNIPDYITKYHKMCGGKLSFIHNSLSPEGYTSETVRGVYYLDDSDIEISTLEKWDPGHIHATVAHELGHFLYFKTLCLWSQESKDQLKDQYDYWKEYAFEVSDEEEAFAFLYSQCRAYGGQSLNPGAVKVVEEAERICEILYNMKLDGVDIGPGTVDQLRAALAEERDNEHIPSAMPAQ